MMIRKIIESKQTLYFVLAVLSVIEWEIVSNLLFTLLSLYIGYVVVKAVVDMIRKAINKWILRKF
mgnify:FL=1|jgi:hypothetical protein|nr:MAG TPA: hypothetical protein [Caudoviricetes sp.]